MPLSDDIENLQKQTRALIAEGRELRPLVNQLCDSLGAFAERAQAMEALVIPPNGRTLREHLIGSNVVSIDRRRS